MELLLVRHAIACERDPRRWPDDGERPLSSRGMARARKAAAGLKRLTPPPARVLTSPLLRTRQTAQILAQVAGWPRATPAPQLLPGTAPEEFLALVSRLKVARIAAVGHEPDLGDLLAACLGGTAHTGFAFRKMGVALVSFHGTVRGGRGRLEWFLRPRLLRAAR